MPLIYFWHHYFWVRNLFCTLIINLWNIYFLIRNLILAWVSCILWFWYSFYSQKGNRVANAFTHMQQVVDSLMMSERNNLFIKFIGRFDILHFYGVLSHFFYGLASDVLLWPLIHWTYRFCTTSVFGDVRVSSFLGVSLFVLRRSTSSIFCYSWRFPRLPTMEMP